MARALIITFLILGIACSLSSVSGAQLIPDTHKCDGVVGSVARTHMTIVNEKNEVKMFYIPYNFKMPQDILQGVKVRVTYRIRDGQNILVKIKKI
jgi:hypothetical protein